MPILKRPDAEIHYEVHGEGFPLLLYAPGGLRPSIEFWGARRRLARRVPWMDPRTALADKFTVISMDQRNAGKSVADVKPDHGWHTFAADHLALIDHLGFKQLRRRWAAASAAATASRRSSRRPTALPPPCCRTRSACGRTATPGTPR